MTIDDKAFCALADGKTADDKAVDALTTALLEAKAVDEKAGASQADTQNANDKGKE
jgi:hypothetical protein